MLRNIHGIVSRRRHSPLRALLFAVLVTAGGSLALAQGQAPSAVSASYELGPRDLVRIEVFEVPELNVEARVEEDGTVTLPVVGAVPALGLTAGELERSLETLLEESFVNRATVQVELTEVLSKTVTVIGAVARPGTLGHPGDWTLVEAITAAGGLTEGHGRHVHVQRRAANGLSDQVSVPIDELVARMDPTLNLPVLPDDVINVERIRTVTIYLLGEVANKGALQFRGSGAPTLLTVIAQAGGLTDRASPRLVVKRRGEDGLMREIKAHYGDILDGDAPDLDLQDGDLVVVKESFF